MAVDGSSSSDTSSSSSSEEEDEARSARKRHKAKAGGGNGSFKEAPGNSSLGPHAKDAAAAHAEAAIANAAALTARVSELERSLLSEQAGRETEAAKLSFLVRGYGSGEPLVRFTGFNEGPLMGWRQGVRARKDVSMP